VRIQLVPSGWRTARELADRVLIDPDTLTVTIGGRTACLPFERLSSAQVWRGPDGVRRYRIQDHAGAVVAVLADQEWRVPGGRLGPLLEQLGCATTSVPSPAGPAAIPAQTAAWDRRVSWHPTVGQVVAVGLLVVLAVTSAGLFLARTSSAPEWADETAGAAAVLLGVYLLLVVAWWSPRRRAPKVHRAVRPVEGQRAGWRRSAGLARSGGGLVAADGWGRWSVWAADGPASVAVVTAASDAIVLADGAGRAAARLPLRLWAADAEPAAAAMTRVADALGLPTTDRPAPAGGQELVDPPAPSLLAPVLGGTAAGLPLLLSGLLALRDGLGPAGTVLGLLAALGSAALLGVGTLGAARRLLRRRDPQRPSAPPARPRRSRPGVAFGYPLTGGALFLLFVLTLPVLPPGAGVPAVAVLEVYGLCGVLLMVGYGQNGHPLLLLPPGLAAAAGLALLPGEGAQAVVGWAAAGLGVATVAVAAAALARHALLPAARRRAGRPGG